MDDREKTAADPAVAPEPTVASQSGVTPEPVVASEPAVTAEPAVVRARRQSFAQRLPYIISGALIGMVLYFALFLALTPLLGPNPAQLVARILSMAAAFYVAVVYPQRNPRAALGLLALSTAAALAETVLMH
ncbi:MAG TPA: hypothetical protein VGB15_05045 [Longimicrobium sp.]|jgi:hypothetical protein